jgi:hypothetical protein
MLSSSAANAEPRKYRHLVEEMDRMGRVDGVYRKLKQRRDEERISGLAPSDQLLPSPLFCNAANA